MPSGGIRTRTSGIMVPAFVAPATVAGYTGPGDIVSGATAWYGLRAYKASYATGSNPCVDLVKTSDGSAAGTFNILSDGTLDVASIAALGFATSVTKIYDQTGGGIHLTQATLLNMPGLVLGPVGSGLGATRPTMRFSGGGSMALANGTGFGAVAQQLTISSVFNKRLDDANFEAFFGDSVGSGFLTNNSANGILLFFGGSITPVTVADAAFHRAQLVANNTTSHVYIDGTDNVVDIGSATGWAAGAVNIGFGTARNSAPMDMCEVGIWPVGFSAGNMSSVNANQQTYWF